MTSRERMLRAFEYRAPDRIPIVYHPSPAGLHVHGKRLLDLFNKYPPDNPISFDTLPRPDPSTINEQGEYREIRKDEWGTVWESVIYGITGHVKEYPLRDLKVAKDYPFPPLLSADPAAFRAESKRVQMLRERYLVFGGWVSIFERLQALRPIDDLLVEIYREEPATIDLVDRLTLWQKACVKDLIVAGYDVITFGDDWGFQTGPFLPPELFRKIFVPRYRELFAPVKQAGRKIFFHSCGTLGPILDELINLGIDGIWHQVSRYDEHALARTCKDHGVCAYIHPDRQRLIPFGTPDEIRQKIRWYADLYHSLGGGGIFYVEIENDAPFENVQALIESVHEYA